MNVLITAANCATAQIIAATLARTHTLRLTDLPDNVSGAMIAHDLDHDASTDDLVAEIDAIVNVGFQGQAGGDTHLLDYHTRRMYNLLLAAADAGVSRVVNVSTLRLYEDHEENLVVTERWRTDPPAENVELLAAHMAEVVCKEFARDRLIQVVNLRLGWPFVDNASVDGAGSAAITHDLIGAAVAEALTSTELAQWQDIHIQSPVESQRFITKTAANLLPGLAERLTQ